MVASLSRRLRASLAALAVAAPLSASAAPLDFAALPAGGREPPPARRSAPFAIPGERVAVGLYRVAPDRFLHRGFANFREFVFFDAREPADAYTAALKSEITPPPPDPNACFATASNFRISPQQEIPIVWDTFVAGQFAAQSFSSESVNVIPVRAERWIEAGGKVRVETTQFWVDVRSGGTRLISRSESELLPVATPFAGVSVHAQKTGPDSVAFFVRRDYPAAVAAGLGSGSFFGLGFSGSKADALDLASLRTISGEDVRSNPCAFQRVDLTVPPEAQAVEDAARRRTKAALQRKSGFSGFVSVPANLATVAFSVVLDFDPEPESPSPAAKFSAPLAPHGAAVTRGMVVNLGVSAGPEGALPIPSVSYRWLGRKATRSF